MSGLRNKAWSRANVTINQVWQYTREPGVFWRVYQCHHADELIELVREGGPGEKTIMVGTRALRNAWERVT